MQELAREVENAGLATLHGVDGSASRTGMSGCCHSRPGGRRRGQCCHFCSSGSGAAGSGISVGLGGLFRAQIRSLESLWSKYLSFTVSADKPGSAAWGAAENTVLTQLATDPSLTWRERADRLAQMVVGAPHRSASTIRQRWARLQRIAADAGWRCELNDRYRVAGWHNHRSDKWSWEYPVRTA